VSGWLVIGAGYTGARVVEMLRARGDEVAATRRDVLDVGRASVEEIARMVPAGGVVVVTAPPSGGEAKVAEAAARAGAKRIVYVSSTGVYAPAGGAWVDEEFALAPATASGRARLEAEEAIGGGAVACVRLRAAGIHGPGRGVIERMRAGTFRVIGSGETHVSRVHVDDLAAAVVLAGDARAAGSAYNVADDDPCTTNEVVAGVVERLGIAAPPRIALEAVDAEVAGMFTADRRIDNRRLRCELGWEPRFPSWRTVLDALDSGT
jgi:nucleoside-diphosphate-sugar epimerase